MKKKNAVGAVIMAGMILLALPMGAKKSLRELRDKAENQFYYDQAGYSIYDGLEKRTEAAKNLITVANRYTTAHTELTPYVNELDYQLRTVGNMYDYTDPDAAQANASLGVAARQLADALEEVKLEERDEKYPAQLIAQMESEQDKMGRSSYNTDARAFNSKRNGFPVRLLGPFINVPEMACFDMPEAVTAVEYADAVEDTGIPQEAAGESRIDGGEITEDLARPDQVREQAAGVERP